MINKDDLVKKVEYHIARNENEFVWIGFVEMWNEEELVFHENLSTKIFDSTESVEDVIANSNAEAEWILAKEDVQKLLNDYVIIKNLGLY